MLVLMYFYINNIQTIVFQDRHLEFYQPRGFISNDNFSKFDAPSGVICPWFMLFTLQIKVKKKINNMTGSSKVTIDYVALEINKFSGSTLSLFPWWSWFRTFTFSSLWCSKNRWRVVCKRMRIPLKSDELQWAYNVIQLSVLFRQIYLEKCKIINLNVLF